MLFENVFTLMASACSSFFDVKTFLHVSTNLVQGSPAVCNYCLRNKVISET